MGLSTSNKRLLLIALFTTLLTTTNPIKVAAQLYSIQTDAIGLLTGTFNAGASMAVSERYSLHIHSEYNPWTFSGNKKNQICYNSTRHEILVGRSIWLWMVLWIKCYLF